MRRPAGLAWIVLSCLTPFSGAGSDPLDDSTPGPPPARYVASGGVVYHWDGASPRVARADPRGDLPEGIETLAVEPYADGTRLLLLQETWTHDAKERGRREGLALILDTGGGVPRRLHQISFEGRPYGSAIAADGSRAYVLARRPSRSGEAEAGRCWIHEIDLAAGALRDSTQFSAGPFDIAVQPDGRRLFATLADRIQSFSTDPLVGSWHYRSPGPNRDLVIRAGDGTICVARGEEVALFDPAAIAARGDAERRGRIDDASSVIPLPFRALGLDLSDDGRLASVRGPDRLAFLDCATQSLVWPIDPPSGMAEAMEVRTLAFPAAGRDLVVALFPAGTVVGFRSPTLSRSPARETAPGEAPPAAKASSPTAAAAPATAPAASPAPESAPELPPDPTVDAGPAAEAAAELSGRLSGDRSRVGAIVLYGPNSIVKEFARARPGTDGAWRVPLPPPGTYRLVPIGDGATPLATTPPFLTIKVTGAASQSGLDFEVRGGS